LALAETLLETHPHDPGLLLALGRLCLRAKLWGKARGYLEASISTDGPTPAYRELGHLLEQLGEHETALEVYRRGLAGTGGPEPVALPEIGSVAGHRTLLDREQDTEVSAPAPHGAAPLVGA
jgi:HemY protein